MIRGLALAAVHLAIVLSLTGKYAWDREHLPRAWARALNYDPNLPVRGRYVSLRLAVPLSGDPADKWDTRAKLAIRDGRLEATIQPDADVWLWKREAGRDWTVTDTIPFYIPEARARSH